MVLASIGATPVDVVELNPYAPRPFVFTEAATCLRESLQAAGWTSNHRFNEVDPQAFSIVLGALPPFAPLVARLDPARTLIANFEQLGSSSSLAGADYRRWLRDWVVLDYHSRNVDYLKRQDPSQRAFEVPIVPAPSLAALARTDGEPSIDVLFFGSMNERRAALVERLKAAGLTVETVSGAYGVELAPAVRRARLVLHVHFYETALFPIARVLQPVAAGVPVVCEDPIFAELGDWSESGILFAPYERLVESCCRLLASPEERQRRAAQAQAFARTLDFATPFRRALQDLIDDPPVAAPVAPAAAAAPHDDNERLLTDEEIEAILLEEGAAPAEGDRGPVQLVMREPGQGRFGRWIVWALIVFSFWTIWQTMH